MDIDETPGIKRFTTVWWLLPHMLAKCFLWARASAEAFR